MFNKQNRFVTKGVNENLDIRLQIRIWNLIDALKELMEVDYLQIFRISQINNNRTEITYKQEIPKYKAIYEIDRKDIVIVDNASDTISNSGVVNFVTFFIYAEPKTSATIRKGIIIKIAISS